MQTSKRVALITGGARRLGAAIARRLHADGYDLALHYRGATTEMQALSTELESQRPNSVLTVRADFTHVENIDPFDQLVLNVVEHFGRLDALVNNASSFHPTPLGQATASDWDDLFASNARAPFFLAQAAAPHLASTRGAIVNLTDIYAERPLRGHALYCMTKAALAMATKALALELAPNVRVNAIAPGAILWAEGDDNSAKHASILTRTPLARTGTPEEIAEAVRWLLRDATYTTGQTLRLDGGRLLEG